MRNPGKKKLLAIHKVEGNFGNLVPNPNISLWEEIREKLFRMLEACRFMLEALKFSFVLASECTKNVFMYIYEIIYVYIIHIL